MMRGPQGAIAKNHILDASITHIDFIGRAHLRREIIIARRHTHPGGITKGLAGAHEKARLEIIEKRVIHRPGDGKETQAAQPPQDARIGHQKIRGR